MAVFSVLVVTAAPPGLAAEAGGAYAKIDGREALLRSVELFLNRDNVKQIQLAVLPDMLEEAKRKFGAHLGFSGVKLISGGPKWADQIKAAAEKISADATHIIVHDAARPAVPFSDIDALFEAAEKSEAVVLASPLRAPLVEVDDGGGREGPSPVAGEAVERVGSERPARGRRRRGPSEGDDQHAAEAEDQAAELAV